MFETGKEMFSLMCDMAEETVERARIKAQQKRVLEVIRIDKKALESVYAKIGRISVTGENKEKREELIEEAKRIEGRILRAQIRYEKLKVSASVDQCTRAFEEKLTETVKSVQQAAGEKARDFADNAKVKGADLSEKIKAASEDFSIKAKDKVADISIKAKDKAADFSEKAKEKAADVGEKAKAKTKDTAKKAKGKISEAVPNSVKKELEADEKVLESTEDILKRIEDAINSVDSEETAEDFSF